MSTSTSTADNLQIEIKQNEGFVDDGSNFENIFEEQITFWEEGAEELEKSRYCSFDFHDIEQCIIQDVSILLMKIAEKA